MALATRCPHCETVFRLDPHLLAPHDGRVRCGHCQEVFDAAHYQFNRDETVVAAFTATTPAATTPDYGADSASPWATKSSAEVAGGPREALGISLHPFIPDTALAPQFDPESPHTVTAREQQNAAASEEPHPGLAAAQALARTRTESAFPGEGHAPLPWQSVSRAETESAAESAAESESPQNEADTPPHIDPFIGRVEPEQARRTDPFIGRTEPESSRRADAYISRPESEATNALRAEPFVGRTAPRTEPEMAERELAEPQRSEPQRSEPASAPWSADPEPRFGGAALNPEPSEPFPVIRETRAPARSGIVWKIFGSLIALVLLVALVAQIAWWQRETVMVYWPASQPLFAQACEQIGCVVAPPRDIDGLQIENSGLRQVDGSHKLELKLSLRNRFDVAIAYPALELTLLDDKNNVAIRRVLWPQDYARPGTQIGVGLPARSTQPVIVRLDTGDAVAANYRVQIFYP
jgi:predicted Zn finger-like uncharacterized protein